MLMAYATVISSTYVYNDFLLLLEFVGCQGGDERDRVKGSFVVVNATLNCFTFPLINDNKLARPEDALGKYSRKKWGENLINVSFAQVKTICFPFFSHIFIKIRCNFWKGERG